MNDDGDADIVDVAEGPGPILGQEMMIDQEIEPGAAAEALQIHHDVPEDQQHQNQDDINVAEMVEDMRSPPPEQPAPGHLTFYCEGLNFLNIWNLKNGNLYKY